MLFTLYGDYIRYRGGEIWAGSLISLLGYLGCSEQAVRSALSRMCQKGWLKSRKVGNKSYYSLTVKARKLLDEGAARIFSFQQRSDRWDGRWHLLTYSIPEEKRDVREKLRKELSWMGYGSLGYGTWISHYSSREDIERLVEGLGIRENIEIFSASHLGFASGRDLVNRCWNLDEINSKYRVFLNEYRPRLRRIQEQVDRGERLEPSEAFVERFILIHHYRKFPFFDPALPVELLPDNWLGREASQLFQDFHNLLGDAANAFFDSVFRAGPA